MWSLLASIEIDDDWILGELLLGWFCRRRYGIFPIFKDNAAMLVESDGPNKKANLMPCLEKRHPTARQRHIIDGVKSGANVRQSRPRGAVR
jgi:hypothetical protein